MNSTKAFKYRFKSDDEVLTAAAKIMEAKKERMDWSFTSTTPVKQFFSMRLGHLEHEVFCVAFLDRQHRLITCEDMFRGTIDEATIYPREVVKAVLKNNAASVILAHNHPSGDLNFSTADRSITETLKEALALIDVRVLDHVLCAGPSAVTMAQEGIL